VARCPRAGGQAAPRAQAAARRRHSDRRAARAARARPAATRSVGRASTPTRPAGSPPPPGRRREQHLSVRRLAPRVSTDDRDPRRTRTRDRAGALATAPPGALGHFDAPGKASPLRADVHPGALPGPRACVLGAAPTRHQHQQRTLLRNQSHESSTCHPQVIRQQDATRADSVSRTLQRGSDGFPSLQSPAAPPPVKGPLRPPPAALDRLPTDLRRQLWGTRLKARSPRAEPRTRPERVRPSTKVVATSSQGRRTFTGQAARRAQGLGKVDSAVT
jgi:hypothetical protein